MHPPMPAVAEWLYRGTSKSSGLSPKVGMPSTRSEAGRRPGRRSMETKVLTGVDPHKATNAVAALDEHGELLERTEFPADRKGLRALERWAANFPRRKWAIEGANGLGRTLAHRLASAGEEVVDVPPKLSARVRVLS